MKKVYLILAATVGMTLASCTTNDYVGEEANIATVDDGSIKFGFDMQNATRADIAGAAAADLLGKNFYVTGTKGTEPNNSPTTTLVFDNYLVNYTANTAGKTASNTANWEYVGVTPDGTNYDKLSALNSQTIKYWDYNADQYDFLAFSTGTFKAKKDKTTPADDEVGVTAMKYGSDLASSGVAYTFNLPSENALSNVYISDITEVAKANYGKEVTLKFKNLGSKVRVALYETIPGYSVTDVKFYTVDGTDDFTGTKTTNAALISNNGIPLKGKIDVYFPHVGTGNHSEADYDKAAATITPAGSSASDVAKVKEFGALTYQLVAKERDEVGTGNIFLGRTLPTASFAGDAAKKFYLSVFPVSTPAPLTLRVDFTLVPIDGAAETIKVKAAKAVVPSTYTKWLPNYAYTYIFKISDNTNGWTGSASQPSGLFPITFDAVVAEATDATGEQTTITTVATPSITTYQQNHKETYPNEYKIATDKDIYVMVMHNEGSPEAHPVGSTYASCPLPILSTTNALLYKVDDATATEAKVMDVLENRTTDLALANVTGRNSITLTKDATNLSIATTIENGPDDNPIKIESGHGNAAKIKISGVSAGTYAFVYDYTDGSKTTTTIYQPITVTTGSAIGTAGQKFLSVDVSTLDGISTAIAANVTAANEAVDENCIYFSKTKNGTSAWTYSFVSVDGKTKLPAGLVKCPVSSLTANVDGSTNAVASTFYFTTYIRNNGKYAVKVIKIVA